MSRKIRSSRESREEVLQELFHEIRAYQTEVDAVDEAVADILSLNRTDLRCLDIISQRPLMTAGQLAEAAGLTTGAITTVIDRLEKAGLAMRRRDETDRRRVLVEPTEKTLAGQQELYGGLVTAGIEEVKRYTTEELVVIRDFLRRSRIMTAQHCAWLRAKAQRSGNSDSPKI